MTVTLWLILALFVKHFVVDFPLQKPYQYLNKGTYGHFGGILHSSLHGLFTALVFWFVAPLSCIFLGLFDAVIHYHVDWAKMNLNKKMGWGPTTHEEFWWLLGADQLAHALTYVWLVSLVTV
jgi:hypothetical protein